MFTFQKFAMTAVASTVVVTAAAQVTTSAVSGTIVDETGEPVIGAQIIAVHVPSNSMYHAVTNNNGRYTIQGMRTGGPYRVQVSYLGYQKQVYENLTLQLGNTLTIDAALKHESNELGEAVVVAHGKNVGGGADNFNLAQITSTPTVDRNIYDIVRNTPLAMPNKIGGISFAGSNNRYNSFQIDGTVSNDVFGLSASGTNGGQTGANPISMDAIQEIQVVVAPFDVRQSGFTGGGINAITKQGTNDFHGSAYSYFNNQSMYGKYSAVNNYVKSPLSQQYNRTFGGTLGGAFIKDKLFFFVSAEAKKESYPHSVYPGYTSTYISADMAKTVADRYYDLTGNKEGYSQQDVAQKSFGMLARIDWNINDNNKLALRYQHNNSFDDKYSPSSSTYYWTNSSYRMNNKTNSVVAELNSHISNDLYNEARVSYSAVRDHRDVAYQGSTVQIDNITAADGATNIRGYIGTEYSSGANYLNQDIFTIEDNLSWYLGKHSLTFGTHNEVYAMKNLFIQACNGSWYYSTLQDFLDDNPYQYTYKYTQTSDDPATNNYKYAPTMRAGQFGFYAQDKFSLNNSFEVTYGLRFDIPVVFNSPTTNSEFNSYAAEQNFGVEVGKMPSAKLLVSPRVGFRWYADNAHRTLVRGGLGIFTGRVPFVWLSNAFNNTGVETKGTTINSRYATVPGMEKYANDPVGAMNSAEGSASKPDIVTVSEDFKYPQVLRANLAVEQMLPGDVKFTLEGIYSKTMNNVFFENLALNRDENSYVYAVPGVEASKAPYYSLGSSPYYSIVNLRNTNKGYTYAITAQLQKSFAFGLDLSASYTFGHAKSVNDGTSSVAYSNWKYNYSVDTNSPNELGFSRFDIPHRVMVQFNYQSPKYWNGWMSTNVSVIYNGFSGNRYSLTMNENTDYNGDGFRGNSLLYIPTEQELQDMKFVDTKSMTAEESRAAFENWIQGDNYAKNHRGQYAERYSNLTRWEHQIDLHVGQQIYNISGIGKLEFTLDIMNFANMLNKKWGVSYSSITNYSPLTVSSVANGEAVFSYNTSHISKADISSRWHCQIGARLTF